MRGICEKPKVKCSDCKHQKFVSVSDTVVKWHLTGRNDAGNPFVMGMYPMLPDETCYFLAVDFDGDAWIPDALAFLETCCHCDIPAALERSRSGNGGHVWVFFRERIPAGLARRLGACVLTKTMERRPDIGFHSYDRFFPNQDTLPKGGFGNLIALPLQKEPRDEGNSVFVDNDLHPFPDQWKFLSRIERMSRDSVDAVVAQAERDGMILGIRQVSDDEDEFSLEPWTAPPSRKSIQQIEKKTLLPKEIEIVVGDALYISKESLTSSPELQCRLLRLAAFQNPEFYKAQAMRLSTHGKPRVISCAVNSSRFIAFPRGCLESIEALFDDLNVKTILRDERFAGDPLDVAFRGKLRPEQQKAARALIKHDIGVLSATTAFGKTVLASWVIAERGANTLVLVHRKQLMEQWVDRLTEFLDLSESEIGRLGGGRRKLKGRIDVALIQSLVRKGEVDDRIGEYGHIVVDECHHISARSFELAVSRAKAKYVTGLSATVIRKDGHHPIIFMQCGPVRHRVQALQEASRRRFSQTVVVRPTTFQAALTAEEDDSRTDFLRICEDLTQNLKRNQQIATDIATAYRKGSSCLVLTERTDHLEALDTLLESFMVKTVILRGGMKRKEMSAVLDEIADDPEKKVILATGRFVGEGFDESRLDTLFLTMPVSWKGTIAQYVGRLHRTHSNKSEVRVFDYADFEVPMLARMFDRRRKGYEEVGYTVTIPASAIPGWPAEVPLPFDSQWKQEYIDSARRLIRDGIDVKLAELFASMASGFDDNAEGADRARSSSERFLFQRLESLTSTGGMFELNQPLPINFGSHREMEVDLLCAKHRLVVEIDGSQHLNEGAYRKDRLKDALLQEHGYFVLRFLAVDIGKELDRVLDTILRVMERRKQ